AREKAELVRDDLLYCIGSIEEIGSFETIDDYVILQNRISKVPFYDYSWIIKYYQMLYPQYFPGMYAPDTLKRALNILGLPYHGTTQKILNLGEISLFIRRCNVNNIIFNDIYGSEWGWDSDQGPCPSARSNYEACSSPVTTTNQKLYRTPKSSASRVAERVKEAEEIEKSIDSAKLEGKEREAFVKVRVNQGEFRRQLLSRYNKCCLCNVSSPEFLIASHIKPWSECEPDEKLDPDNGLLLCPNHDKLFDSGYISFEDSGDIMISEQVSEVDRRFLNVFEDMFIRPVKGNIKYLKYHRDNCFKK
ncbi:MAG: HNH endonuclease, partial [Eubacterium sp.]|nr:HNH endonuclease [Eubacterium sp.]